MRERRPGIAPHARRIAEHIAQRSDGTLDLCASLVEQGGEGRWPAAGPQRRDLGQTDLQRRQR
jgi:hypothetical protein